MLSCFCIFRNITIFTPSWIMVPLALLLFFSSYYKLVGFMFFSSLLFTSLALLLSTFLLFMWKHKAEGIGFSFEEKKTPHHGRESVVAIAPTPMHKNVETIVTQAKGSEEEEQEVLCLSTSEDYEEVDHTLSDECSDGTISDEDSLIEIALPSGHFVGHNRHHHHNQNKEESNSKYNNNHNCCSLQQKKRELSSAHEALFNQQSLMEFLAEFNEMNEEDNLIEIDIAMGSIKCSRLVQQFEASSSVVPHKLWILIKFFLLPLYLDRDPPRRYLLYGRSPDGFTFQKARVIMDDNTASNVSFDLFDIKSFSTAT
ncbi:hypothetical protein D0Y65_053271 [Glycine soja]|uniref:Transmembrane protein n=1 Tax=Glycine soja TaxID=3848 RepID=A0A445F1E1_GLYSO|nr:hypothetical protein D0Y65_053271 [Glycine soja]